MQGNLSNMQPSESVSSSSPCPSRPLRSVRQPVSCEPCRKRKIRCSRTSPPCDTCQRRRCADSCTYRQYAHSSKAAPPTASYEDLLSRISSLEETLRKQNESNCRQSSVSSHPSSIASTPQTQNHEEPRIRPQNSVITPESTGSIEPLADPQFSQAEQVNNGRRGVLTSSRSGFVRFENRSSQWSSVLKNTRISEGVLSLHEPDSFEATCHENFPFGGKTSSREELIMILPPIQQCSQLKDKFFDVFSPLFHILHDPTFHSEYERFLEDPSTASLSWLAILFTILSLAVTALSDDNIILRDLGRTPSPCQNIRLLSRRFRGAAMQCLSAEGVFFGQHTIQSLQALIMLGYAMSHAQDETWVLLGMTYHVAVRLGCHIDPSQFKLNPVHAEERRRCWAWLLMLYTIQNTMLGNHNSLMQILHNVQLPLDTNDSDISYDRVLETPPGPTQMTYLLLKFRLYNLTTKISHEIFGDVEPCKEVVEALDREICAEQESWDKQYLTNSEICPLPLYHTVHLNILYGYSHQLFLLLHRPFFAQSIMGLNIPNSSQLRCIASAEALLDIHRMFCETPAFAPYRWYTDGLGSFHAFHGAAVLAVALLQPIYQPQHQKFRNALQHALRRFQERAQRSAICAKACRVLNSLLQCPPLAQDENHLPSPSDAYAQNGLGVFWGSEDQRQMVAEQLQAEQWISPSNVSWDNWDILIDQIA